MNYARMAGMRNCIGAVVRLSLPAKWARNTTADVLGRRRFPVQTLLQGPPAAVSEDRPEDRPCSRFALPRSCPLPRCAFLPQRRHRRSRRVSRSPISASPISSGEARDQGAEHEARRKALTEGIRTDIGKDGAAQSLALACEGACRLDAEGVEALRQRAREAGAAFVLVGSVHKMSTLVLSMRVAVLDVASGKLVMERLLSFRGDNDEGWRHAGDFVAREVAAAVR